MHSPLVLVSGVEPVGIRVTHSDFGGSSLPRLPLPMAPGGLEAEPFTAEYGFGFQVRLFGPGPL